MKGKREPVEARFWRGIGPMEVGRCWNWQGATAGPMKYGITSEMQRPIYVHRLMWTLMRGPIPRGICVLHHCDNPLCVKPSHLFLGTKGDNARDMVAKGRGNTQRYARERRTCKRGIHPWIAENISPGKRICKPCRAEYMRARRLKP